MLDSEFADDGFSHGLARASSLDVVEIVVNATVDATDTGFLGHGPKATLASREKRAQDDGGSGGEGGVARGVGRKVGESDRGCDGGICLGRAQEPILVLVGPRHESSIKLCRIENVQDVGGFARGFDFRGARLFLPIRCSAMCAACAPEK